MRSFLEKLLKPRYAEPHRHYHTWRHIVAMLDAFDHHQAAIPALADRLAVELAILYHEVIYDPAAQNNEAASARLMMTQLNGVVAPAVLKSAAAMIHASAGHVAQPGDPFPLQLFLDLDLLVLASAEAEYRSYARAIRREYAHVPDAAYRTGRTRVLESFLAWPQIYRTDAIRRTSEDQARQNLRMEIAWLRMA